jgi:GMP synthase-like glutamine amidotransferase
MGKFIIPKKKFSVKAVEQKYEPCAGTSNEFFVKIKKLFRQHYLFKGVDNEFLAWNPTAWQIHPISFLNPAKKFTVVADGDFSPQIIELKNFVGCLFNVNKKYPMTMKILENYVKNIVRFVKQTGYQSLKIDVKGFLIY